MVEIKELVSMGWLEVLDRMRRGAGMVVTMLTTTRPEQKCSIARTNNIRQISCIANVVRAKFVT